MAVSPPSALDFSFRLVDGRGLLGLRDRARVGGAWVDRLELEVPELRFPFDVSGGAGRFQKRRCRFQAAALRLDEAALDELLRGRKAFKRFGLEQLSGRIGQAGVVISGRARVAERETGFSAKLSVWPAGDGQGVRVYLDELRPFGFLPAPAPLVGLGLLLGLGATPDAESGVQPGPAALTLYGQPALALEGIDRVELNALELILWGALPPRGWRLPAYRAAALETVATQPGALVLGYGAGAAASVAEGGAAREALHAQLVEADRLLARGELWPALEAYQALGDGRPEVLERRLAILASMPARFDEAERLAARLEAAHPERPFALLAAAAVQAERGDARPAALRYARAFELLERAGERADALEAALRAGEEHARAGDAEATAWLEKVLAAQPGHARAAALLASRYERERRWGELLALEKRRLSHAEGTRAEAEAHARIGRLLLEELGEPQRARDELERAVRLAAEDGALWALLARARDAAGATAEALEALERAAALSTGDLASVDALLQAADLAERTGAHEAALGHLDAALARAPEHPVALARRAALLSRLGRIDDAQAAYERAVDAASDDAARAPLLCELARLQRDARGDRPGARATVERSLKLRATPAALRLAAELAEADGRAEDLEQLLGQLAATGDREAPLRHARVLLELGRYHEAAEVAEGLSPTRAAALKILVEARAALGQSELLREALERLVQHGADEDIRAARVRLGCIYAEDGELDRARALLHDALATPLDAALEHQALEALCDVLLRQGDDAALDVALGRLAEARPPDDRHGRARAWAAQGAARARRGLMAEAKASYERARALEPDDAQVLSGLGEAAFALHDWDTARAALEPLYARGIAPRVERALRLGEICEEQGDTAQAVGYYQAALAAGASGLDGLRAWNALQALYRRRGDLRAEAQALLDAADDERTGESDPQRASRLVQAADLLRKKAGRPAEAAALYERALQLDALQLAALDALEAMAEADGDVLRQEQVLARKVAATARRPAQQKAILGRLAQLQADKLGRPDAARLAFQRALEIDPDFRPALAFLAAEARARGDAGEELLRLERLATLPIDPSEPDARPQELLRVAQLHAQAGRTERAEEWARRALEAQPKGPRALQLLDEVLTQAGRLGELPPILLERAHVENDPEQVFALLLRRAQLLETHGTRDEAIAAYDELTTLKPSHVGALMRLAALLRQAAARAEHATPDPRAQVVQERLATVLSRLAERHATDGQTAEAEALYVEVSHLYHDRLRDPGRARTILERALEVHPRSRLALGGLLALARAGVASLDEDVLYGRLVELGEEPGLRAHAVAERARARRDRGDLRGAAALLRDLDVREAPEAVLKLRVELDEATGAPEAATPALEVLRARAEAAGDVAGERWALRRLVAVAAQGGPTPAAEALCRRAVALDPDDRDAVRLLAQLERARGDDRAYLESLDRLLRTARRTFEGAAREAELCLEMAEAHRRLGEHDAAEARAREASEATPGSGRAHRLRGMALRALDRPAEAAAALERAAGLDALDAEGYVALGECHEQAGDAERAAEAFARAGDAAPPHRRAEALERAGKEAEALELWRKIGGEEALRRAARLERLRAERAFAAGRYAEARVAAVEVLVADPREEDALEWALHGLSPAATLALLEELSVRMPPHDAGELYRRLAPRLVGEEARVALQRAAQLAPDAATLVQLAERLEAEQAPGEAARAYQQALVLDPGCAQAALGLARVGLPSDAARALAASWDQIADARTRARLSAALGVLLRDRLDDLPGAREAFRRAVAESDARDAPLRADALRALAALERAAGDARAAEEALETLRAEGAAAEADLRHLAELYAERGLSAQAIEVLTAIGDASDLLMRCLEEAGRHAELVALIEREAPGRMPADARALYQRAAALCAGPLEAPARAAELLEKAVPLGPSDAELWVRLGHLYSGPLGDADRASRCFARAYAADRSRTDVLLPLADFHHAVGEWEPAGDYYVEALQRNAVPPEQLAHVHLRLAEHARRRADAIAEEEALLAAVTFGAAEEAWPRLAEIYRVRGDKHRLATALKQLADRQTGELRKQTLRELVPLVQGPEAAELDERILAEDPGDDAARERVIGRLRAAGDLPVLLARLERELGRAGEALKGPWALELAQLAAKLGEEVRAVEAYRLALAAAPSVEAARGLMQLLARAKREGEAAPALEAALFDAKLPEADRAEVARLAARAHLQPGASGRAIAFFDRARREGVPLQMDPAAWRALLRTELRFPELVAALDEAAAETWDPEQRLALEVEAADVLDRELGQRDEAARRYAGMLDRHPHRRDLAERARQLYAQAGEPIHALAALDKELRLAPPEDLAQLKIVRGELLLAAGADAEAEAEFLHALITTPRVGRAHAALAEVYKRRGDLAGALEHLIAAADAPDLEPARAAGCAVDAADVLLKEADAQTAERLYQLAAALDPANRAAVDGLARLAAARGDHERQAELLGRAVLLASDRRERARLCLQRARLFQLELLRDLDAYRCFKEAVACDPDLLEAVRGLREMAEARGEWALAAEQRYRELHHTEAPLDKAALHVELGRVLEEKLLDTDEAVRHYEQAMEICCAAGHARRAPWPELVRLYTAQQRLREAAQALDAQAETLTHVGEAPYRAEALARAGELYERSGDPVAARERLQRAAAIGGEAGRKADESLLRLADESGDPEELRARIEERLALVPEGAERLGLLRRLLELAAHGGDAQEIDLRARAVLSRAPDDPVAFVELKRVLEGRGDEAGVAQLLRARAEVVSDPAERAERRFEAGRLAERLGDPSTAVADYEAALEVDPDHVAALDALAELAYRSRQLQRARALYAQLGARPSALAPDEVLRRRAELAEDLGYADEARGFYEEAAATNPSNLEAHEAVARLALARGSDGAAFAALKAVLDLLPLDAVDRITDLRRQLGRLAMKLGELEQARNYFELVLAQDPARIDVLEQLVVIYVDQQAWDEAADAYGRLSYLAEKPQERAELLFKRGEILRLGLDDLERANDAYLKAADLCPTHAPTLRRLIVYYYREGDHGQLRDVAHDLESLPATLDEASVEAGLGIALGGDEARGTVVVAVAQPSAARVAEALSAAKVRELEQLDPAIRAAARALGGAEVGREALKAALRERVVEQPEELGARRALGRLYDLSGDARRARLHYGVLAFVDPLEVAGTRLRAMGTAEPIDVPEELLVNPGARGPLRDALTVLGPLVLGLAPAPVEADAAPVWVERLRPVAAAFGVHDFEAAVVLDLADPAWAEPTRPPRLLFARRALADEAVARFAAARALHVLHAGVSLVEGRAPDDVAALVRAAATLFLPDLAPSLLRTGPFVQAWQTELHALLRPEALPESQREHLEMVLAACVTDSAALAAGAEYAAAERHSADRVALARTGDLRAGLAALAPAEATTAKLRLTALREVPALVELLAFAATLA